MDVPPSTVSSFHRLCLFQQSNRIIKKITLCDMNLINLAMTRCEMCKDCWMMTPIDSMQVMIEDHGAVSTSGKEDKINGHLTVCVQRKRRRDGRDEKKVDLCLGFSARIHCCMWRYYWLVSRQSSTLIWSSRNSEHYSRLFLVTKLMTKAAFEVLSQDDEGVLCVLGITE